MHGKTMREALQEARNYRDPTNEGGPGSGPQKDGASKPDDKSSPKAKIDKVALQKDLEDKVTDGMIDIDHGKDGSMDMSKEYEGGQDYEVDRDVNAIKKDLMSKGISEKDIEIDIEEDEEYINLNVSVKGKPVSEGIDEGGPGSGPQKGGKKQSSANIKKAYGILNDPRFKQGNYSGAAKAIDKLSPGLSNHPDVKNAMKRANEEIEESLTKIDDFELALRTHMVHNLGLSADAAAKKIKKYKNKINKSMGVVHNAGMLLRKEESQITEKKAEFLRLDFKNKNEVEKLEGWMYKFISQVNAPYDSVVFNKHRLDGFSVEFEGMDDADALMTKLKRAGFRFKVDMRENLDLSATGDTTTSNASQENKIVEKIIPGQLARLKKEWEPLRKVDMSKHQKTIDQIKVKLKRLNPSSLSQIVRADIFMVSDIAKELMKEEIDEAVVGLPFSRTLMYIIKTDRNTATRIKSFLADNGEKYPIHVDDNGSGQITLDAYNYTGGEKKAALAAAQAIAKKFNVKVNATR